MISKEYGKCILSCDICGAQADEKYESFQDALDAREDIGWKSKRVEGEWLDICPDCIE
jgi:hypothetical protein